MAADPLIEHLNRTDEAGFIARVGPLYEHSPWIAEVTARLRPFDDRQALHDAMQATVQWVPVERQIALIQAHPDLAGKLARAAALEPASTGEQQGLGLDRLSDAEYEQFDRLNTAYRARFGFPFVIAARAHTKQSVLAAFEARLRNTPDEERATALSEIGKIAWFRLQDLD